MQIDFKVFGQEESRGYVYPMRQFKPISVFLKNTSKSPLQLNLCIQPYQDFENGTRSSDIIGKLVWEGCLEQRVTLQPEETIQEELTVCFLGSGTYNFVASCENGETKEKTYSRTVKIIAV